MIRGQILFGFLAASGLVISCGQKRGGKNSRFKPGIQYFVHGNTEQLVSGATFNTESFLVLDNLDRFQGFHVANWNEFVEQSEKYNPSNWEEVEAGNSTEVDEGEVARLFSPDPWYFVEIDKDRYVLRQESNDGEEYFNFGFQLLDEKLSLTHTSQGSAEIRHYSLKSDEKAFSFLLNYDHPQYGKVLFSITFASGEKKNPIPESIADYSFLIGSYPIRWDAPLQLNVCGSYTETQRNSIEKSVAAWFDDPSGETQEGRLPFQLNFKNNFAPFSDLNEQCLSLVSNFKMENSDNYYIAGVTVPNINLLSKTIIDSDIFLFVDHIGREFQGTASSTAMHEIGHFFGLGHEFRVNSEGEALYPSIMAYRHGTEMIQKRDFEALRALYGKAFGYAASGGP